MAQTKNSDFMNSKRITYLDKSSFLKIRLLTSLFYVLQDKKKIEKNDISETNQS